MSSQETRRHPLSGLLTAQFFGAFNDNAWKYILLTLAMRQVQAQSLADSELNAISQQRTTLAMLVFSLPFVLLSLPAGTMADRISKRSVIIATKALELLLMLGATAALSIWPGQITPLLVILGLMGMQSALFSPAKYGVLPELLPTDKLSGGNALMEMWTMLAIIAGTGLGPILLFADEGGAMPDLTWIAGAILTLLAAIGFIGSLAMPRVLPARAEGGLGTTIVGGTRAIFADRMLLSAVIGSVAYWLIISLLGQNVYVHTSTVASNYASGEMLTGLPPALFGIGIAIGAICAGRLSAGKIEVGLIPMGALIFASFTLAMGVMSATASDNLYTLCGLATGMGLGAGLLVVPLNSLLQWRSPSDRLGSVLALTNVAVMIAVIGGSLSALLMSETGLTSGASLGASAVVVLILAGTVIVLMPSALIRMGLIAVTRLIYRLRVIGRANVPEQGGVLLTPNHMAFLDGLFVMAAISRPVRFVVYSGMYNKWWLKPFMKAMKAIEIDSNGGPRMILKALRDAGEYLDRGEVVCIFPEGQITRTGTMMPFRRGVQRIVKGRDVPVIPVHLDRIWGSIFSFKQQRFVTKAPEHLPYPITVSFGAPLSPDTPVHEIRSAIVALGTEAWAYRKEDLHTLHRAFIQRVRSRPWRFAWGDDQRPALSRLAALTGAVALARALRPHWGDQKRVGVMLPPSVAGAMTNLAASLGCRSTVHLNFTAGKAALESAMRQSELKTLITSKVFLSKAKIEVPDGIEILYLEDVARTLTAGAKRYAALLALFAPMRNLERACGAGSRRATLDDETTVIFSSGSTGEPKGVVLSHYNLASNIDGAMQLLPVGTDDKLLGILPLFHSFGYMTTWFASNNGIGLYFHPNPLDGLAVGRIIEAQHITVLIATPTFLGFYLRRCEPGQLGSLRLVLTGAEKLPDRLADAFEERFGIRPMQGYGTTECSPIVSANTLDVRYEGVFHAGSRRGSVGQALQGVSARVVDPDTFEPMGPNQAGMLLVCGPNIMQGYLGRDDLTHKAMHDGWYITGDIAKIDDDGFIFITDRLSRFSKIAGEMVPHGRVEEALHEAAEAPGMLFAVTAIPDEKKGEKLVVLHTWDENKIDTLPTKLTAMGLPNLFIPRPDQFVKVDEIPMLGTGKLDLRQLKAIALEKTG